MGKSIRVKLRRVGLAGSLTLVAAGFGVFGVTGGSARGLTTAVSVRPVSASEKWIRVAVAGSDSLDVFGLHGSDFTITRIKSVRASGVPAPSCTVNATASLVCVGHVRSGASVFVNVLTSGAGGSFAFARANAGEALDLSSAQPAAQGTGLLPVAARMTRSDGTKTLIFSGQTTFDTVEILPTSAFRIGAVSAVTVAGKKRPLRLCKREGDGLVCSITVPTGSIGKVTFTAPRTYARTIYGLPGPKDSVEIVLRYDGQAADRHVVETRP